MYPGKYLYSIKNNCCSFFSRIFDYSKRFSGRKLWSNIQFNEYFNFFQQFIRIFSEYYSPQIIFSHFSFIHRHSIDCSSHHTAIHFQHYVRLTHLHGASLKLNWMGSWIWFIVRWITHLKIKFLGKYTS